MAKLGSARHPKVLSSGRLTGSSKLAGGKKQIALRKAAHSDADCGYSLYSTDSEDQVATIHHGLDRCAALLKDILQNDSEGMETVCRKGGKAAVVKTTGRPLLSKVSGLKKRGPKKKLLSTNVHKEIAPVSTRKTSSGNAGAVGKDAAPANAEQAPYAQPVCIPCTQHSPVMHQKLCEQIQTQMSLLNMKLPQKSDYISDPPLSIIPENVICHPVTAFNSRLPSSTPALSPQHEANPAVVHPGVSINNCAQCASQMGPVLVPATSSDSASAQVQPAALSSALSHVIPSTLTDPVPPTVPGSAPNTQAVSEQGNQEQWLKEADIIKCIQAHLAVLQAHEKKNGKASEKFHDVEKYQDMDRIQSKPFGVKEEDTAEEYSESICSEEEDLDGVDMAPVRDTGCQTSFDKENLKPKKPSLQKTTQKIKTLKYLLGELKTLLTDHDDSEMLRLLGEVEDTVSLLPAVTGNTNVQAEIALALQPLRSENAQLRRRLRILNQQLKDQGRAEKECNLDSNFEFLSLQSLNVTLQAQLSESVKSIELLQNKNEELIKFLESQKEENKRLTRIIHERDQELLEKRQQYDIESAKLKLEADEMLTSMKHIQYKLEAAEKENQILGITLRQRDAEVNRLRELTRALQGSMTKLLADLTVDTAKPNQERSLSKSVLEIHEKQLQPDAYRLSDSVMSYLKKLETDPDLLKAEAFSTKPEMKEPNQADDVRAAEHSSGKSPVAKKEIVAPRNVFTFLKADVDGANSSSTLVEEPGLDETIYIPLSSSPSQKPATAAERRADAQHQFPQKMDCDRVDSKQTSRFGVMGNGKFSDKFYSSCCPKNKAENKAETAGRTAILEGKGLQMQPKETNSGAAKVISDNPDRLHPDKFLYAPISHQKGNMHNKDAGISAPDSSFSTFDWMSGKSEWTISSFSTFTSRDEEDFKNGLAALDANIARLQKTLQNSLKKTASP